MQALVVSAETLTGGQAINEGVLSEEFLDCLCGLPGRVLGVRAIYQRCMWAVDTREREREG
jgi:hypothetical protein